MSENAPQLSVSVAFVITRGREVRRHPPGLPVSSSIVRSEGHLHIPCGVLIATRLFFESPSPPIVVLRGNTPHSLLIIGKCY